jgi:multidrug resistance protein, MATE family
MLTPERVRAITKLAFPITIAFGSTLMMSVIDLAMVGTQGATTVAAVGLATFSYSLFTSFVIGIEPAVQGLVARSRGEGSPAPRCLPLNAGLLVAVSLGLPLTGLCYWLTSGFFPLISSDAGITRAGVPFLQILYLSIVAVGLNAAFEGTWNGMERPRVYMLIVLLMNCLNILLNYMLIFGHYGAPRLGAIGAAIGTTVSLYTGVLLNTLLTLATYRSEGFLSAKPSAALVSRIIQMGVPSTLQNFFFAAGFIVFLWLVGMVGTTELAAANVLVRVTMVLTILAMALGMVSATLVSKAVGEGDMRAASQWGWDVGTVGIIGITLVGVPLFLMPQLFLSIFLNDPHAIEIAVTPLRLVAATTGLGSLIYIFAYTLFSLGDGNRVILVSFSTQWILFLPGVWLIGLYLHKGLLGIWLVQMAYGACATALITAIWMDGRWKRIKLDNEPVPSLGEQST